MARRGQKMNLGEFLGDKAQAYIPEAALPTGPRVRDENEDSRGGYGDRRGGDRGDRGDRYGDRPPSRSDESGQWRGDRASGGGDRGGFGGDRPGRAAGRFAGGGEEGGDQWRGGGGGFGGPSRYDRPSRDEFQAEERPAHMRLNLQRRDGGDNAAPRGGAGFNSRGGEDAPRGGDSDKFASAFGGRGGGRFGGDRERGDARGGYGGDSRGGYSGGDARGGYGGDARGGDRFGRGDRYEDSRDSRGSSGLSGAFNSMRVSGSESKPQQQAAPEDEKKARAQKMREERKQKAEEERLALEEAKRVAAEAKKAAEEAEAKKAEVDRAVMAEVLASGKTGEELKKIAKEVFAKSGRPSGAVIFEAITKTAEAVAKASANWIAQAQYGGLLKFAMADAEVADQVKALYALQIFLNAHEFPKGVMEKCFMALYTLDIIEEKAFLDYKYDVDSDAPGRMKAIVQTSNWLTWLETPEDEESEEEDE